MRINNTNNADEKVLKFKRLFYAQGPEMSLAGRFDNFETDTRQASIRSNYVNLCSHSNVNHR